LVERAPRCEVEISPRDAERMGLKEGSMVKVLSRRGQIQAVARITDKAVEGTVFVPFHYVEAAANLLTHASLDPVSKIPGYKVCAVRVEPI